MMVWISDEKECELADIKTILPQCKPFYVIQLNKVNGVGEQLFAANNFPMQTHPFKYCKKFETLDEVKHWLETNSEFTKYKILKLCPTFTVEEVPNEAIEQELKVLGKYERS